MKVKKVKIIQALKLYLFKNRIYAIYAKKQKSIVFTKAVISFKKQLYFNFQCNILDKSLIDLLITCWERIYFGSRKLYFSNNTFLYHFRVFFSVFSKTNINNLVEFLKHKI